MRTFKVPATLEGVSTLKDGGVSMRFHTQELTAEEKTLAFGYQTGFGWLLFQEKDDYQNDIDLGEIRKDTGGKSPSQRMRSVLYLLWMKRGRQGDKEDFIKQVCRQKGLEYVPPIKINR